MIPRSMAGRLTLSLIAGLIAMWLVAVAAAMWAVRSEVDEVFDSILQETAQRLMSDITAKQSEQVAALRPGDGPVVTDALPHEEYITYRLFDTTGRVLLRSHSTAAAPLTQAPAPGFSNATGTRSYTEPSVDGRWLLMVAEPPDHRSHTIEHTLEQLMLPLLGLIMMSLVGVPWAVRRSFGPVAKLKAEIAARGGANLTPIEDPGLPSELQPIRDDVNLLLRRLRQALEAEHNFSATAAHELRTPIAAALAQGQWLAARLPPGHDGQAQAEAMIQGLRRLARRIEKLLQLARAEAGVALRLEPVDLLVPLHLVVEEFAALADVGQRLSIDDGGLEQLMVAGDLDTFAILLRNLVENALAHGPADGRVEVAVDAQGVLRVTNGGPVVPAERLAQLAKPFVSHGGQGSGLGLSIVQAIAEQVGATLSLHAPAPGRADGFEARLRFRVLPG
jgi:two-component system OmpR family sensor kinase